MTGTEKTNVGGRPPKKQQEKRGNRVAVHFSDREAKRLREEADARGLTHAAFVRACVLEALGASDMTV